MRTLRKVIGILIAAFLIINCDRIFPDINTASMNPGFGRSICEVFNETKHTVGAAGNAIWSVIQHDTGKTQQNVGRDVTEYTKKTMQNTRKVIKEDSEKQAR